MLGAKVMKKELNYLASKRWVKVGRRELRLTPYKQEIHPWPPKLFSSFLILPFV
jgi:hypothetical protein